MSKCCSLLYIIVLCILIPSQTIKAQGLRDSIVLEKAFQSGNLEYADSILKRWSLQSINKSHAKLRNDTVKLVYKAYSRFMDIFLHGKMKGRLDRHHQGNYFFVQNRIVYNVIDSVSFEDFHYFFNTLNNNYDFYKLTGEIQDDLENAFNENTIKSINPFYPDLKSLFRKSDPMPIYIKRDNRLNTILQFLGYSNLTGGLVGYASATKDKIAIENRENFLDKILCFGDSHQEFNSRLANPFIPYVSAILVDVKMRYAIIKYKTFVTTGNVYLSFFPLKVINSKSESSVHPITWVVKSY